MSNYLRTLFAQMGHYCYYHRDYKEQCNFEKRDYQIPRSELENFLKLKGFHKEPYDWTNGTISISLSDYSKGTLYELNHLNFFNPKTRHGLKYGSFDFGEKIFEAYIKKFTDYKGDAIHFNFTGPVEDWKKYFFDELDAAITEINGRMSKKLKKDMMADKLQSIENDIDYAIDEVAEELKEFGIVCKTQKNEISSVTLTYSLYKKCNNLHRTPTIWIRKLKTGKNTICYRDFRVYDCEMTAWKKVKAGTTADEIKQFIRDYFEPWKGLKDIYTSPPNFIV